LEGQNLVSIKPGETEFKKHGDTRAGIIGHVLQQLEHYWCPSTLEDDLFDPKIDCCKGSSSNALICHPLEVEGCGCIGAIQVIRDNNDNFTPLEIKLLKLYSVKVAATLGVQQLHLSSEMYRTQCTTLAEVWSGTVEPVESISRLIMNTCKVVGADFALYYQQENVDPKGVSTLQLVEMHVEQHVESTTLPQANVPLAGCLLGKTVTTGRSVVGIVHELEGFNAVFDTLPDVQVTAVLMVPVKRPDMSVMGVVYAGKVAVGKHQRNMGFVEDDLQKVVLMCGLLAQLTSWRQLQDDMYKIEDQCTRLSDLVSFLCNTNSKRQDHEIQLRQMVRLAKEAVGAEVAMLHITLGKMPPRDEITVDVPLKVKKRCEICVVSRELANDDDEEGAQRQGSATEVETVSGFVDNKVHVPPETLVSDGMIGHCIMSSSTLSTVLSITGDTLRDPEGLFNAECDLPNAPSFVAKPMAILAIPILSQDDEPLGALTVLNKQYSVAPFSVEDSTLLNILANSLAACILAENEEREIMLAGESLS